jgi:hypothetical protein
MTQTLEQLSAAATRARVLESRVDNRWQVTLDFGSDKDAMCQFSEAYRTGQLVAVQADDATVERVARTLAPNLEGGREFDQMPKDRAQLRQWTAQGMCLINDATQDDATWLAQEAIKAAKGTGDE